MSVSEKLKLEKNGQVRIKQKCKTHFFRFSGIFENLGSISPILRFYPYFGDFLDGHMCVLRASLPRVAWAAMCARRPWGPFASSSIEVHAISATTDAVAGVAGGNVPGLGTNHRR